MCTCARAIDKTGEEEGEERGRLDLPVLGDDVVLDCLGDLDSRLLSAAGIVTTLFDDDVLYFAWCDSTTPRFSCGEKVRERRMGKLKKPDEVTGRHKRRCDAIALPFLR